MPDYESTVHNLPNGGDALIIELGIWQSTVDGLCALIHWLNGFEAAGKGRVPGHFELVMHFRSLTNAIRQQDKDG